MTPPRSHPRHRLDPALTSSIRYSLLAILQPGSEVDFATLRDLLETDDSVLSKAISGLASAGYVDVRKGYADNRPRTWARATGAGCAAFVVHTDALLEIARTGAAVSAPVEQGAS